MCGSPGVDWAEDLEGSEPGADPLGDHPPPASGLSLAPPEFGPGEGLLPAPRRSTGGGKPR